MAEGPFGDRWGQAVLQKSSVSRGESDPGRCKAASAQKGPTGSSGTVRPEQDFEEWVRGLGYSCIH